MTKKSSVKKLARKMQAETGWSYQACLNKLRPTLDELTPVEPLSEAITTYATGPLSPGDRHEARVVAKGGELTVHHGLGRHVNAGVSAREIGTGYELIALVDQDDGDSFTVNVPYGGRDVVVEIVVVGS